MSKKLTKRKYSAWLDAIEDGSEVLTLDEYRKWYEFDDNLPWRLGAGHLVNLLDEAIERIEIAVGA